MEERESLRTQTEEGSLRRLLLSAPLPAELVRMNPRASGCLTLNSAWNFQKTPGSLPYLKRSQGKLCGARRQRSLKNGSGGLLLSP